MSSFALDPSRLPIRIQDFDPADAGGRDKERIKAETVELRGRIGKLQELLYANANQSLLILLQGMDTSGKDGASRMVLESVNPAGVQTSAFKAPNTEERAHDYLWRVHRRMPERGYIGVFNRSHYEEVLIVRVDNLVPEKRWKKRYAQINAFEEMLVAEGTIMLKFFLHISKEEQKQRLEDRIADPHKNWKFQSSDLLARAKWADYMRAYEDVLNETSTAHAPWHIVPADKKWVRDFIVAKTVVDALETLKLDWPKPKEDLSKFVIE